MPTNTPNDFDRLVDIIDEITKKLSSSTNNIDSINKLSREYAEALRSSTRDAIDKLSKVTLDNEKVLQEALDKELKVREDAERRLREARENEIRNLEEKAAVIDALRNDENENHRAYLNKKRIELDEDIKLNKEKQQMEQAIIDGDQETYNRLRLQQELRIEQEKELNNALEKERKVREENIENIRKVTSSLLRALTDLESDAISNVTRVYNEHAGQMAALLDSTVEDISSLQNKIAEELRSNNLSSAISNVAILAEASSLAAAGYTDQTTLQQNAVDISIAKEIAPTLDFNNSTVKNLINIFGSDFTHKFSAILQAVQETAGATINVSNNLSTLMTNLEPVYQNAEYQQAALQGSADVTATLASAREQGIITQAQEREYLAMLNELMDPSKAFRSSNLAVRVAATQYDYGSGNPAEALQALINAQQSYYSNFDQSNSYMGNISRSLGASVAGNDTMSATYNGQGLTDLIMVNTSDLESTYNEQLSKLQEGNFTTVTEKENNLTENSAITQTIADFAKDFPILYRNTQTMLVNLINSLPDRFAKALNERYVKSDNVNTTTGSTTRFNNGKRSNVSSSASIGNSTASTTSVVNNTGLAARMSQAVGGRLGTIPMISYGTGIMGALNLGNSLAENGIDSVQGWGMEGDVGTSALSYGGIGAAIGSLIAPGLGTLIGGAVGAIGGLVTALWAQKEIEEENTAAIEKQNQLTEDIFGDGLVSLTAMQAQSEIARGGGTIDMSFGTVAMDTNVPKAASGMAYVPYDDYLVKLHKGEAVVTANAAQSLRQRDPNFWNTPNYDSSDVVFELKNQTQSIVNAIHGDDDPVLPMRQQGLTTYNIRNVSLA